MLKDTMKKAFQEALDKVNPNKPTLFILRGFTELMTKINIPDVLEPFDIDDLDGNYPRFILAELFQVLSVDEEIYRDLVDYAHLHPDMAIANIHSDRQLSMLLFSISYLYEEHDASTAIIREMEALNYDFVYIDFNLYEPLKVAGGEDYFPINHQPVLHLDMEVYSDLEYPGLFNPLVHQIAIINYMEKLDLEVDKIKVFKNDDFIKQLNIDLSSDDLYLETSKAFFNYFSVFDRLH